MKKLNVLLVLLFVVAVSCSKDDEAPSFKKENFIGTWEDKSSADSGCTDVIKYDDAKAYSGTLCSGTLAVDPDGYTYTFDGKQTITVNFAGITETVKILSLNSTTMKVSVTALGINGGTITYTKVTQ
jgi:hypothetical protein